MGSGNLESIWGEGKATFGSEREAKSGLRGEGIAGRLFDSNALCQVSGFIHVTATAHGSVVSQKLQRHDREK